MLGPIRRPVEVPEPFHLGSDVRSRSCPSSVVETCRMPLVFVRATTMIVMTRLFAHTIIPRAFPIAQFTQFVTPKCSAVDATIVPCMVSASSHTKLTTIGCLTVCSTLPACALPTYVSNVEYPSLTTHASAIDARELATLLCSKVAEASRFRAGITAQSSAHKADNHLVLIRSLVRIGFLREYGRQMH